MMKSANRVPINRTCLYAHCPGWVFPIPGSTGLPSRHNSPSHFSSPGVWGIKAPAGGLAPKRSARLPNPHVRSHILPVVAGAPPVPVARVEGGYAVPLSAPIQSHCRNGLAQSLGIPLLFLLPWPRHGPGTSGREPRRGDACRPPQFRALDLLALERRHTDQWSAIGRNTKNLGDAIRKL